MTEIKKISQWYSKQQSQEYEEKRLEVFSPVEFEVTKTLMKDKIPKDRSIKILEVGVGYGHYSHFLVQNFKAKITLIDITPKFLKQARDRIEKHGLGDKIEKTMVCSATYIREKIGKKDYFDVVIFLGPLYHLIEKKERIDSLQQAYEVLKPGGVIFMAGINRLSCFRDTITFASRDEKFLSKQKEFQKLFDTGIATEELNLPIGTAYFHLFKQFKEEITSIKGLKLERLIGCESFGIEKHEDWVKLSKKDQKFLLSLVFQSCEWEEGYGRSDHFLGISRKI